MKHLKIFGNIDPSKYKDFTESEIAYYQRLWDFLHFRYRNNKFFSSLWDKLISKKRLTKNQWIELEFLLKNGKSRYEAGLLPPNY
jgi:hypothetical protein